MSGLSCRPPFPNSPPDRGVPLVLPGVGSYITKDAKLVYVGIFFRVDSGYLWMQGFVAGAGKAGIALVDLGVGISLLEVGQVVPSRPILAVAAMSTYSPWN